MIQFAASNSFQNSKKKLTRVGLGGEGILRTSKQNDLAHNVIKEAYEQGITYFDTARVYMDSEVYYGNHWGFLTDTLEAEKKRVLLLSG